MTKRKKFSRTARERIFLANEGKCASCGVKIQVGEAWAIDHVLPLALGGSNDDDNLVVVHDACHKDKTVTDIGRIRKADRQRASHRGFKSPKQGFLTNRNGKFKKKMDGTVVLR